MKNSHHRMKHEQKKAIRAAQKNEYATEAKEMKEEEIKEFITSPHTNKIARGKASSKKKARRTCTEEISEETAPNSTHQEGRRWIKAIQKQILDTTSRIQKKIQKWKKK